MKQGTTGMSSYFSSVCIEECKGICCDPWWGIISYQVSRAGGLGNRAAFTAEVTRSIKARAQRIVSSYVTRESPPRRLFDSPDIYNVKVRGVKVAGTTVTVELLAMFAFRCNFLSGDNVCGVHPYVLGGEDIRPPRCAHLGTVEAGPGTEGHCRIIHAAEEAMGAEDRRAVTEAIEFERSTGKKHLKEGFRTAEKAAGAVVEEVVRFCSINHPAVLSPGGAKSPGRNDPCHCGSGKKFKKCHGR